MSELPPLSSQARELLADERTRPPEDAALKLRVLERAREALSADRPSGVALRGAGVSGWPKARHAPRAGLLIAAAVAVAGLAAAGAGVYRWTSAQEHAVQVPIAPVVPARAGGPLPQPLPQPVLAPEPVAAPVVEPAPSEPHRVAPPVENARPSSVQEYTVELGLLEPARRSIGSGNYAAALSAIAKHQREYPRGQLAEEREALRVRALWGMGQKPAAESAAAVFRKRYPRSVLLSWMKEPAKPSP